MQKWVGREGLKHPNPSLLCFPWSKVQSCPLYIASSSFILHLWISLQPQGKLHLCGSPTAAGLWWGHAFALSTGLPWQPALWRWPLAVCLLSLLCWIIDERLARGEGGWNRVLCILSLISFCILTFFFFSLPLWLLPLYIDKMSCIWKMISGRNTEFLLGMCI